MAQHILMKDNYVVSLVTKAIHDPTSLKWNVVTEKNPLSRIDLQWIRHNDGIVIPEESLKTANVYYVEVLKPSGKLKRLLQEQSSFHFEVFEFTSRTLVYWVI